MKLIYTLFWCLLQIFLCDINATASQNSENFEDVTINCKFNYHAYRATEKLYICYVDNEDVFNKTRANIVEVQGHHFYDNTNDDVTGFCLGSAWQLQFFPRNLENVLENLVSIEIKDCDLRELKRQDLQPFPNLKYLYLENNKLQRIDIEAFQHNSMLEILFLSNNQIFRIEPNALSRLKKLRRLVLYSNDCKEEFDEYETKSEVTKAIGRIQNGECTEKEVEIECKFKLFGWYFTAKQYICEVTKNNVFDGSSVRIVDVNGQHFLGKDNDDVLGFFISHIPNVGFFPRGIDKVFKNLEAIEIEFSNLTVVTQSDLKPFAKLKYLYLEGNSLKSINANLFKFNPNLQILWINSNDIDYIDPNVLSGFRNQMFRIFIDGNNCRKPFYDIVNSKSEVNKLIERIEKGECTPNDIAIGTNCNDQLIEARSIIDDKTKIVNDLERSLGYNEKIANCN